jgi:hypothetical protein
VVRQLAYDEEIPMGKKIDNLRCVVQEMGDRYGADDVDVRQLKQELRALEVHAEARPEERRKTQICRYTFGSVARQKFNSLSAGQSRK